MALLVPEFLQTKQYSAQRMRSVFLDALGVEGVAGGAQLLVSQRAAGANMSVDVAAGGALIKGDTTARQGTYHAYNDATVNVGITANSSGAPRLDQVVLRIYDSIDGGAGSDQAVIEVIPGIPVVGATLDNRNGAASASTFPSSLLLADVLVASGAANIASSNIRDRRAQAVSALGMISWSGSVSAANNTHYAFSANTGLTALSVDPTVDWDSTTDGGTTAGLMTRLASAGRLIAPTTGIYVVSASGSFAPAAADGPRQLNLRRNWPEATGSVGGVSSANSGTNGTNSVSLNVVGLWPMYANQDMELTIYQNSGAALNFTSMKMQLALIGPAPLGL